MDFRNLFEIVGSSSLLLSPKTLESCITCCDDFSDLLDNVTDSFNALNSTLLPRSEQFSVSQCYFSCNSSNVGSNALSDKMGSDFRTVGFTRFQDPEDERENVWIECLADSAGILGTSQNAAFVGPHSGSGHVPKVNFFECNSCCLGIKDSGVIVDVHDFDSLSCANSCLLNDYCFEAESVNDRYSCAVGYEMLNFGTVNLKAANATLIQAQCQAGGKLVFGPIGNNTDPDAAAEQLAFWIFIIIGVGSLLILIIIWMVAIKAKHQREERILQNRVQGFDFNMKSLDEQDEMKASPKNSPDFHFPQGDSVVHRTAFLRAMGKKIVSREDLHELVDNNISRIKRTFNKKGLNSRKNTPEIKLEGQKLASQFEDIKRVKPKRRLFNVRSILNGSMTMSELDDRNSSIGFGSNVNRNDRLGSNTTVQDDMPLGQSNLAGSRNKQRTTAQGTTSHKQMTQRERNSSIRNALEQEQTVEDTIPNPNLAVPSDMDTPLSSNKANLSDEEMQIRVSL